MKKHSLNLEIWKYFLLFSILILGFLWTFQVLFLDKYYEQVKIKDISIIANIIKDNQDNSSFENIVSKASFDRSVCVQVIDPSFNALYSSFFFGKGCFTGKEEMLDYKYDFINSGLSSSSYELINPRFNNKTLVQAIKLSNNRYAFINSSLDPIDSTIGIIRSQLVIITIVVLLMSFVIAYFISNHISRPVIEISEGAKNLAAGKFDVEFNSNTKILELNELTETLNYTREELSKTEEFRRDLMANVSHDLKTPLTMIKAYAEMSRDLHTNNEEKRKEDMGIIIDEVDRLNILVNDILDLSRMQSNIEELVFLEFDLVELIQDVLKKYQFLQEVEHYQFDFYHPKKKIMIRADKKKIYQVIYNLINNAINYTGEDKTVTIKITDGDNILVEIIDSGRGIKEEDLPYIWDKYYKSEKKHKRNLVGTGLGLSIVKNILVKHGYQYGVSSKKKMGSNFYFIIPKEKKS